MTAVACDAGLVMNLSCVLCGPVLGIGELERVADSEVCCAVPLRCADLR